MSPILYSRIINSYCSNLNGLVSITFSQISYLKADNDNRQETLSRVDFRHTMLYFFIMNFNEAVRRWCIPYRKMY